MFWASCKFKTFEILYKALISQGHGPYPMLGCFQRRCSESTKALGWSPKIITMFVLQNQTPKSYPLFKPECRSRLNRTRSHSSCLREKINFPQTILVDSCFGLRAIFAGYVRTRIAFDAETTKRNESNRELWRWMQISRAPSSPARLSPHTEGAQVTRMISLSQRLKRSNHNKS